MVTFNSVFEFDHLVEFSQDGTTFAAARENGCGHIALFLINEKTGKVYVRNGRCETWEQLEGRFRASIIARLIAAKNNHVPTYRINGEGPQVQ